MNLRSTKAPRITVAVSLSAIIVLAFAIAAPAIEPVEPALYALSNPYRYYEDIEPTLLYVIDPANGEIIGAKPVLIPGEQICTTHGLVIHPTDDHDQWPVRLQGQVSKEPVQLRSLQIMVWLFRHPARQQ